METRFHSPYKRWLRGVVSEILILTLLVLALGLIGAAVAWVR